jgi:hypothetical protein
MKQLLLLNALTFLVTFIKAQTTNTFPSTGNVGIGITSPAALFHVAAPSLGSTSGSINELARFSASTTNNSQLRIQLKRFANGTDWSSASTKIQCVTDITNQGYLEFNPSGGSSGVAIGSSTAEVVRFLANGNVLIGKTSQSNSTYKLDVNGSARINKIVVNTNGADFVFNPSYELLSLDELEKFVHQNHHLPEVASAAEMRADGINLGENQTILLQKTEELTLYLIEQNKQLQSQSKTIIGQSKKISELESMIHRQQKSIDLLLSKLDSNGQ